MVNKGEERKEIDDQKKGDIDNHKKGDIDDIISNIENMKPEDMLKDIYFMLGRNAVHSKEEIFSDMSDKVGDFGNYVTSSARLFNIETMVYLQVGFNTFMNGISSFMATKAPDEPKERLILGILESSIVNIQDKIDDIKMRREQRILKESNSELN